ncbi:hypothetical protein AVEN_187025-1 [Araneus ventricosus]|uniref:Uncharacterized protein n=1 Tax=Araneus ventricosus TaxID=182803 RepID=A0A4Y2HBE2_ARAVE|nr:hypothetical protein AVEN_187025-1 [Araneus ventricosus]
MLQAIWSAWIQNPSSMRISDENWTVVVETFGYLMPFVFPLARSDIKQKYDHGEGERCSFSKAKITHGGGVVWVRVSLAEMREGRGDPFCKRDEKETVISTLEPP